MKKVILGTLFIAIATVSFAQRKGEVKEVENESVEATKEKIEEVKHETIKQGKRNAELVEKDIGDKLEQVKENAKKTTSDATETVEHDSDCVCEMCAMKREKAAEAEEIFGASDAEEAEERTAPETEEEAQAQIAEIRASNQVKIEAAQTKIDFIKEEIEMKHNHGNLSDEEYEEAKAKIAASEEKLDEIKSRDEE